MKNRIKRIISFSALFFLIGFIGAFLGKSFEKTKVGQKLEKSLGIKNDERENQTAQGIDCIQQSEDKDDSQLFVGCNGFF